MTFITRTDVNALLNSHTLMSPEFTSNRLFHLIRWIPVILKRFAYLLANGSLVRDKTLADQVVTHVRNPNSILNSGFLIQIAKKLQSNNPSHAELTAVIGTLEGRIAAVKLAPGQIEDLNKQIRDMQAHIFHSTANLAAKTQFAQNAAHELNLIKHQKALKTAELAFLHGEIIRLTQLKNNPLLENEKQELIRLETERREKENQELVRLETERLEREKQELVRLETERLEREKQELKRLETERLEKEKQELKRPENDQKDGITSPRNFLEEIQLGKGIGGLKKSQSLMNLSGLKKKNADSPYTDSPLFQNATKKNELNIDSPNLDDWSDEEEDVIKPIKKDVAPLSEIIKQFDNEISSIETFKYDAQNKLQDRQSKISGYKLPPQQEKAKKEIKVYTQFVAYAETMIAFVKAHAQLEDQKSIKPNGLRVQDSTVIKNNLNIVLEKGPILLEKYKEIESLTNSTTNSNAEPLISPRSSIILSPKLTFLSPRESKPIQPTDSQNYYAKDLKAINEKHQKMESQYKEWLSKKDKIEKDGIFIEEVVVEKNAEVVAPPETKVTTPRKEEIVQKENVKETKKPPVSPKKIIPPETHTGDAVKVIYIDKDLPKLNATPVPQLSLGDQMKLRRQSMHGKNVGEPISDDDNSDEE